MVFAVGESSSSFSSAPRSWTYHVFVSFRGEDTRRGFTDHLYASLERNGIKTFKDDKDLERGEVISTELLKAIEESMFAIIVLSPNYASSSWCLDELQKIVECKKNLDLQVMPVFYGVDPSNVRHQRETFEEAFKKHEEKLGEDGEKVQKWRNALTEVAGYSGWDSKDRHEAELVESIAQHIHVKLIPKLPSCTENFVGIASKVKEVNELIGMGLNDVRFIGIWGMGGIGKTTIARTVYEAIRDNFKFTCFLANVGEVCETNDLVHVQRVLLSSLNINCDGIHNLYDGKETIIGSLSYKKVLLVLDDVSDKSHLESLAAEQDWFGPGSRILITTRDKHLLRTHGVSRTYEVEGLVQNEALQLFCFKAFKQAQPEQGYLDLSEEVVKYTGGLPLALDLLGSHLHGRAIDAWYSALKQIKSSPFPKIQDALKISYEGLSSLEKNLFLDIACFFRGMNKNKVVDILKCCGHCPIIGIEVLIERSLVTLAQQNNSLEMHDLLQDMGRNIVFQESPDDPGKRSRLWSEEDIDHVFIENKGTEAIQGIVLNLFQRYEERWSTKVFFNTSQLKLLILNGMELYFGLDCLPRSLRVLHWRGCPLKSLPLIDQSYEFVEVKLSLSKIEELWHGKKFLGNMKYMDLSFSMNLKQLPDFSGVPNLETLTLEGCKSLTMVHSSLVHHKRLVLLNLKDCPSLEGLPSRLEMNSLKELILTGCSKFQNLPEFGKCMKHLSLLSLQGSAIQKLPTSVECLVGLEVLNLEDCKLLVSLPYTIRELHYLKELNLSGCFEFQNLPDFGENMKHLSKFSLDETAIRELPSSLGCLVGLISLSLTNCENLICLPDTFDRLKSLTHLSTYGCSKLGKLSSVVNEGLPRSILTLPSLVILNLRNSNLSNKSIQHDFCDLPSLQKLDLSDNNFVVVPINISKLSKLEYLGLCFCPNLRRLPELPSSIKRLNASNCYSLETSKFSPCNLFTSIGQHPPKVVGPFDMLITGGKIPSWFVHKEDGEYVSVPPDCTLYGSVGIALCFLLISDAHPSQHFLYTVECCLVSHLGKRHIMERQLSWIEPVCPHLYILLLTGHEFMGQIRQDSRFGLFQKAKVFSQFGGKCHDPNLLDLEIVGCGSRVLYMQDIEVLNHSNSIEAFKAQEQHALGGGAGSDLSIPFSLNRTSTVSRRMAKIRSSRLLEVQGQMGSDSPQQTMGNGQSYGTSQQGEPANAGSQGAYYQFHSGSVPVGFYALQRENIFPERPDQPECQFYMKTGDCKFGAACGFHHPRERIIPASDRVLSPRGLPLRPGEPVCLFYSRYGKCKFGPSCKFDHPMGIFTYNISASPSADAPGQRLLGSSSGTAALN